MEFIIFFGIIGLICLGMLFFYYCEFTGPALGVTVIMWFLFLIIFPPFLAFVVALIIGLFCGYKVYKA